ncbi:MAG: histidinol dehydrogenase [Candidatus Omnitrophota bacterium]
MKVIKYTSKELNKILNRNFAKRRRIEERIKKIIDDVRLEGDDAVIRYTRKFDRVKLTPRQLRVSEAEATGAYQNIDKEFISSLKAIIENVSKFYRKKMPKSWKMKGDEGVILGENYTSLNKVGIYIPSAQAPLISSVYMTVVPAKVAGVKEIYVVTPPNKFGSIDPHILVVANLLKVDAVYKVGGAQAIAALAFGTKTIPKVDKIVGPGNIYVTEAKRQVFGYVDLDMMAGPSEIVIIANQHSNLAYVLSDLAAQKEHTGGLGIVITPSKALARQLRREPDGGYVILVKNLDHAAELANEIAPEHLEIMVKSPNRILKKIKNAGAVFIGPYSPAVVGDYAAGPSHVLPTGGTARFFSGLSLSDFVRSTHVISYTKKALEKAKPLVEKMAGLEGLPKHVESIRVRFKE